jgi:glycosyltransferase involved in cell wall biosynthesis
VHDGVNGFLVPPGNAAEIARILHRLSADPALLRALRAVAYKTPARFPDWDEGGATLELWLSNEIKRFCDQ